MAQERVRKQKFYRNAGEAENFAKLNMFEYCGESSEVKFLLIKLFTQIIRVAQLAFV